MEIVTIILILFKSRIIVGPTIIEEETDIIKLDSYEGYYGTFPIYIINRVARRAASICSALTREP